MRQRVLELQQTYQESEGYRRQMAKNHELEVHRHNLLVDELTK